MKPTGHRPPRDVRPRTARFGLGRAVAAAPAMLGSLLLLTLVSVTLGRWVGLLLPLVWVAGAAVLMTRVGKQVILRAAFGFRRPIPAQAASLQPAWSAALVLQRHLWGQLSSAAVVGGAGLGLASSAPPGPVGGVVQAGSRSADEGVEQAPEFGHGQGDELAGCGCGAPLSAVVRVAER